MVNIKVVKGVTKEATKETTTIKVVAKGIIIEIIIIKGDTTKAALQAIKVEVMNQS